MPKIEFELLKVWENSGKTIDRYTVKIGKDLWEMSDDPLSPEGSFKYCGEMEEGKFHPNRWGKPVSVDTFQALPVKIQKAISSLLIYRLCHFDSISDITVGIKQALIACK